jgi:glycosyltransferase involved in cell wall biosynthesis
MEEVAKTPTINNRALSSEIYGWNQIYSARPLMKRVLFLNHNYENYGTYFRCFYLGKYLSKKRYRVELVCASKNNFDLRIKSKIINESFRVITLPRIRLHEYHTGHSLRGLINSVVIFFKDYDILHSFAVAQPATAIPTVIAKRFKDKPIIVDWDDIWGGGFADYHPSLVRRVVGYLEKNVPKVAEKITVVSELLKEKAEEYGYNLKDVIKIPNGANIDEIKPIKKMSQEDSWV